MYIRRNMKGQILIAKTGKMLLRDVCCLADNLAICVFTQNFEHYWCVECSVSDSGRGFRHIDSDTTKVSYAAELLFLPGEFDVFLRWVSGHSPYPEIEMMSIAVYGVYIPARSIPMAPDEPMQVAHVEIGEKTDENGMTAYEITVNGQKGTRNGCRKYMKE